LGQTHPDSGYEGKLVGVFGDARTGDFRVVLLYDLFYTHSSDRAVSNRNTQASFADVLNVVAFFLTNSCKLIGPCPVSVSTSFDIRS
jgi:hypothetical protein